MAEFQITEQDFVRAAWFNSRWRFWRLGVFFVIAAAMIVAAPLIKGRPWLEPLLIFLGIIVLLTGLIYFLTMHRLKKAYREQESLHQPFTMAVDEQEIRYTWPRGNMTVPWSAIRRYSENADFFLLFESTLFGRILPKRALSEEETALIRRKIASLPRR